MTALAYFQQSDLPKPCTDEEAVAFYCPQEFEEIFRDVRLPSICRRPVVGCQKCWQREARTEKEAQQ